ncbi:MAG: purine-binding chemotaxis protein CheW [Candidatus Rokubacteria bacterium]|nr:purine-binding chemotaxis protein CheW [Candidatus Rokubacteria bacterium]
MANGLNWQAAYALLERARRAIETGAERPPEDVKRILRERAQALAKPLEEAPTPTEVLELLVFSLSGERYGIETAHVLEVVTLRELTPVPCTPSFVLGVVNHRGRILSVLDLRRLFDLAGQGVTEGSRVVAVEAGGMRFGIFADAVAGTMRVGVHEVAPPPVTLTGDRQAFVQGVTGEMVAVLDLEALAHDPRITVNEEVG